MFLFSFQNFQIVAYVIAQLVAKKIGGRRTNWVSEGKRGALRREKKVRVLLVCFLINSQRGAVISYAR